MTYVVSPLIKTFDEKDLFYYIVAVLSSPLYRERYKEFLKRDYPKVPITSKKKVFKELSALGEKISNIHLMKTDLDSTVNFPESGDNRIEKPYYEVEHEKLWINPTQFFTTVPRIVWEYDVGGHQVLIKWIKYREGRLLDYTELVHLKKTIESIKVLIQVQGEIDQVIAATGGFPLR